MFKFTQKTVLKDPQVQHSMQVHWSAEDHERMKKDFVSWTEAMLPQKTPLQKYPDTAPEIQRYLRREARREVKRTREGKNDFMKKRPRLHQSDNRHVARLLAKMHKCMNRKKPMIWPVSVEDPAPIADGMIQLQATFEYQKVKT